MKKLIFLVFVVISTLVLILWKDSNFLLLLDYLNGDKPFSFIDLFNYSSWLEFIVGVAVVVTAVIIYFLFGDREERARAIATHRVVNFKINIRRYLIVWLLLATSICAVFYFLYGLGFGEIIGIYIIGFVLFFLLIASLMLMELIWPEE